MKTNTLGEIKEKNTMLLLCVARNNMLVAILEQRKRRKCIRIAKTVEYAGGKDGLSCSKFHLWMCAWAAAIISSMSYIFFGPNIVPFMYNAIVFVIYGTTSQCVFPLFHELSKKQQQKMALARCKRGLLHCRPNRSVQVKMKKVRAQASNIARDICFIINGHHSKNGMLYCDFAKVG